MFAMTCKHRLSSCVPGVLRGWLAVGGGFLVHLTLGTIYTTGNMIPYMVSYIRSYSHPEYINYATSTWIFALAVIGQGSSMFIGGIINAKIGPRWTTLFGSWLMSAGVLLTAATIKVSFYLTLVTYGLLFGVGVGIAYAPPLACAMKWFPNHKGLVNGIVVAGFGGGAFIFNQVQTAFINPHNKVPDQPAFPGSSEKYFSKDQAESVLVKVPHCFLLIGSCYAVMQFVGSMFLVNPIRQPENTHLITEERSNLVSNSDDENWTEDEDCANTGVTNSNNVPDVHPTQVLKTRAFYYLWFMFLLNGQGIIFISTLYKAYGQTFITNDHFLALVGAFASIFNCVGRVFWGKLCDRFSFKISMVALCTLMIAFMATLKATEYGGEAMFFIWICLIFFTFSGNFVLFPTATAKAFGQKYVAINYGLVFTSQVVTGAVGATLTTTLKGTVGWVGMIFMVTGFTCGGLILTFLFNKKNNGRDI